MGPESSSATKAFHCSVLKAFFFSGRFNFNKQDSIVKFFQDCIAHLGSFSYWLFIPVVKQLSAQTRITSDLYAPAALEIEFLLSFGTFPDVLEDSRPQSLYILIRS